MTELDQSFYKRRDTTPLPTRFILLTVLITTAVIHSGLAWSWLEPTNGVDISFILWLFTGLFVLRVIGQILVALRPRAWLPPMRQWNFVPYPVLLPIQLVFIVVMIWIDLSFSRGSGVMALKAPQSGEYLIIFSAIYGLAMVIRYIRRMYLHPDQRWFGGTIPIIFHLVLASYLYVIGLYHVAT